MGNSAPSLKVNWLKEQKMRKRHSRVNWKQPAGKTEKGVPASMQALIDVAELDPAPNTNGTIMCPGCGGTFRWYRSAAGKLMGECDKCTASIPRG